MKESDEKVKQKSSEKEENDLSRILDGVVFAWSRHVGHFIIESDLINDHAGRLFSLAKDNKGQCIWFHHIDTIHT